MVNYKVVDADKLDSDLGTIADAIREHTGSVDRLPFPGGFVLATDELVQIGKDQKEQEWGSKFYTTVIRGNDKNNISFPLPFKPDLFYVVPFDAYAHSVPLTFTGLSRDFRSFAIYSGRFEFTNSENNFNNAPVYTRSVNNFVKWDAAASQIVIPTVSNMTTTLWRKGALYRIIAHKYAGDKTDRELLEEYILGLPDEGGSLTIDQKRYNESGITDTQWAELIAQKPNWTFVFFS